MDNLLFWIEQKHLVAGDYLVLDNASVHSSEDIITAVAELCDAAGVTIKFLPAYSPELNPIEMLFGYVKRHLREEFALTSNIWVKVMELATLVDNSMIHSWYKKSQNIFVK